MICPKCRAENKDTFKFCVKCGESLIAVKSDTAGYKDMGGYHSESDFSGDNSGFTIGDGVFRVRDNAPTEMSSGMYTSDELNSMADSDTHSRDGAGRGDSLYISGGSSGKKVRVLNPTPVKVRSAGAKFDEPVRTLNPSSAGAKFDEPVRALNPSGAGTKFDEPVRKLNPSGAGTKFDEPVRTLNPSGAGAKFDEPVRTLNPSGAGTKFDEPVRALNPSGAGSKFDEPVRTLNPSSAGTKFDEPVRTLNPSGAGSKFDEPVRTLNPSGAGTKFDEPVRALNPSSAGTKFDEPVRTFNSPGAGAKFDEPVRTFNSPGAGYGSSVHLSGTPQSESMNYNNPYMNPYPVGDPYSSSRQFTSQPLGMPPPMYSAQPQIVGYDQMGKPIYSQPQQSPLYGNPMQPQIIGYDATGRPIYSQPPQGSLYGSPAQPQIIGYDAAGKPIYSQPPQGSLYGNPTQPQIIGYDVSGMPVYATESKSQNLADILPSEDSVQREKESSTDDFWNFFDGGKSGRKHEDSDDDFFGKSQRSGDMGDVSAGGLDTSRLKKASRKKIDYMGDTPIVDASELRPSDAVNANRYFMRQAQNNSSNDLMGSGKRKNQSGNSDYMTSTKKVDVRKLSTALHHKSRVTMNSAGDVSGEQIETYVPEHKAAIMAEADRAVEALPKKRERVDELDLIELPPQMRAKKTVKSEDLSIPSLPEKRKK